MLVGTAHCTESAHIEEGVEIYRLSIGHSAQGHPGRARLAADDPGQYAADRAPAQHVVGQTADRMSERTAFHPADGLAENVFGFEITCGSGCYNADQRTLPGALNRSGDRPGTELQRAGFQTLQTPFLDQSGRPLFGQLREKLHHDGSLGLDESPAGRDDHSLFERSRRRTTGPPRQRRLDHEHDDLLERPRREEQLAQLVPGDVFPVGRGVLAGGL